MDVKYSQKAERLPERQACPKVKTTSNETGDDAGDKVPGDNGVKIEKTTERVVSSQRATESALNSTKGETDIPIPAGSRIEKAIEVTKASVVRNLPSAKDRQIATEKSKSDRSYPSSVKTSEVDGCVKSSSNDLSIEASTVTSSVSTITKTAPGGEPKETTAAKPKASAAMNRRGVTPGGIGKLTARFENNKPANEPAKSSTGRREPFVRSSLSDKKQLFDGSAAKPKTNGNSVNYRDILTPSSKTKNATALGAGKLSEDKNNSPGRLGTSSSSMSSRYQVKPSIVEKAPAFIQRPRDQTGIQGGSLYFAVSVEGTPTPDISWHYKGKSLKDEGRCEIYTEKDVHFLEIFELEPSDAGIYTCRLVNKAGRVSAMAELKVIGEFEFVYV